MSGEVLAAAAPIPKILLRGLIKTRRPFCRPLVRLAAARSVTIGKSQTFTGLCSASRRIFRAALGAIRSVLTFATRTVVIPRTCSRKSTGLAPRAADGVATGPVLSYVTGGYAYGSVKTESRLVDSALPGVSFSLSQTRGGYVLGSGVEASLGGNWTGKIEYLYVDLGTQAPATGSSATVSSRVSDNIFRGGLNYRFGGNSAYSAPIANWRGFYIGGNAGSLIARDKSTYAFANTPGQTTFNLAPNGFSVVFRSDTICNRAHGVRRRGRHSGRELEGR